MYWLTLFVVGVSTYHLEKHKAAITNNYYEDFPYNIIIVVHTSKTHSSMVDENF